MTSRGVVREYHPDEGWGVIDAPDVPGGCWVHFSAFGPGFLEAGQEVSFRAEPARQDGFAYRAVRVWIGDVEPGEVPYGPPSDAFRSSLTLTFDDRPE
jgi:CspA family cold shock protein